jgi:integrase
VDTSKAGQSAGTELVVAGRDLAVDATRLTAGERFSERDYKLMEKGVAKNTRRTLRAAWKHVLDFTGGYGFLECPMPVETCVKLFDWAWQQNGRRGRPYAPSHVKLMLWAITKAHAVAMRPDGHRGYLTPVKSEEVKRAARGYRRQWLAAGYRDDKASPIEPDEAIAMIQTRDVRSPQGLRDALAISWLYDGGFRAGELVVTEEDDDERRLGVEFEDVELHAEVDWDAVDWTRPAEIELGEDDRLVIHVPMSKTDQEGDGDEVVLPAHPVEYAFNCPVRLYIAWSKLLRERGLARRSTVLRVVAYGGPGPRDKSRPRSGKVLEQGLGYAGLARLFAQWIDAAELEDPEGHRRHLVLHGMRAGSAEAAAERGADTPELNRHFRWSQFGTTAQRYAARGRKRRNNPAARIWSASRR